MLALLKSDDHQLTTSRNFFSHQVNILKSLVTLQPSKHPLLKMRFQSTIAILTAFSAPFAVAAPVPEDNVPPVPDNEVSTLGAQMGFYVCDGYGFSGYCQVFKVPFGQCSK